MKLAGQNVLVRTGVHLIVPNTILSRPPAIPAPRKEDLSTKLVDNISHHSTLAMRNRVINPVAVAKIKRHMWAVSGSST